MKRVVLAMAVIVAFGAACGPKTMFRLSSEDKDNDREALAKALAARQLPEQAAPQNSARQPRVFVVEAGTPKTIVAYDLNGSAVMWQQAADVQSRIWIGGDFIIDVEGKSLVARDQKTGTARWKVGISGSFIGASADKERAYLVWREGNDQKPKWFLAAYDANSGKQIWMHDAEGSLGAPVAQNGVVYSPFLSQWLAIIDGKTGVQLARLRGIDEQISVVRSTSRQAYYGSKQGVFLLDGRSASGKKSEASYAQAKIPPQLDRTTYGPDVYDPVQQGYTAADRAHVLLAGLPTDTGPMKLAGDTYAVHYFRYIFGFNLDGELTWAYSNPRVELVASDHTGTAIVGLSQNGEIIVLDPKSGSVHARKSLGTTAPVLGATFDADGWSPLGQSGDKVETVAALVQIARDRDARFDRVKELAVSALAKMPGAEVTKELLAVLTDKRAPLKLKDTVVEMLAQRKDPASLPVLTEQLATHADFLAKTDNDLLTPTAKAIAALGGTNLDPKAVADALVALQAHLEDPATSPTDMALVIKAMAAIGGGKERPVLMSHLLLYHADDELGVDATWQKAIVGALSTKPGPAERELLRQVSADPRTQPGLMQLIKDAMAND
ncbi:MAG TPA: PQQ-binding-like beta-propeller repeat protein [Kofleriaceae bacterium]|nr:PQQ-binding-like beta-propeller repeat protein [Kofleriaceae bacterium]